MYTIMKTPPPLKKSPKARVDNGRNVPFSDSKIMGVSGIETQHPSALRKGFTKKLYTQSCGKGGLPGQDAILKKS